MNMVILFASIAQAFEYWLARGDVERASAEACKMVNPTDHLKAMERVFALRNSPAVQPAPVIGVRHMLTLVSREAVLSNFNPNSTKKGKEREPRATINVKCNVSKETLAELDPQYLLFYTKRSGSQNDLADAMHDAPDLRFPLLVGPFSHFGESIGAEVEIEIGPAGKGGKSNILLNGDLDNVKFTPKQGGTTEISFRFAFIPTERDGGKLSLMHQQKITINVTPPEATDDTPVEQAAKPSAKEVKAAAKAKAAEAFEPPKSGDAGAAAAAH